MPRGQGVIGKIFCKGGEGRTKPARQIPMKTRFHADEVELLDQFVEREGLESRQEGLKLAITRQIEKIKNDEPAPRVRGAIDVDGKRPTGREMRDSLKAAVDIDDSYDKETFALANQYRNITGCRSLFAVARHALAAELKDQGVISADPPQGFTPASFAS